jgi:hypothetical protein
MKQLFSLALLVVLTMPVSAFAAPFLETLTCTGEVGQIEFVNVSNSQIGGEATVIVTANGSKESQQADYLSISSMISSHSLTLKQPLLGIAKIEVVFDPMNNLGLGALSGKATDLSATTRTLSCQKK